MTAELQLVPQSASTFRRSTLPLLTQRSSMAFGSIRRITAITHAYKGRKLGAKSQGQVEAGLDCAEP
jgi:hypothetical protein